MPRVAFTICLLVSITACAPARRAPAVAPAPTSGAVAANPTAPSSPATEPDSIRWVRSAAEYRMALAQVYREAGAAVEQNAAGRSRGSWAVVLDADETVISNLTYQAERAKAGLPYTADSWRAWVMRKEATPLPGAREFLARVRDLGGRIAIVTNRLQSECADTEAVFVAHLLVYDAMLCRPDAAPSDKNPRFAAVASGQAFSSAPLDVLAFIGDNILDFPQLSQANAAERTADFGVRFFIVPNPMYGSWQ